jgi:RNA polymerase sigma factor (sigma-70 family)
MEEQELRQVIARATLGDAQAIEELLSAYRNRLYGYFFRATRRVHESEDLLGELSFRVVKALQRYKEQSRFEPWLFRIAANLVRDRIRRIKSRPSLTSLSAGDDDGPSMAGQIEDDQPSVEHDLMVREATHRVHIALDTLDETTREMILDRHFGELSFKELAEKYECPLGTVLARVHRGMKALRTKLEHD